MKIGTKLTLGYLLFSLFAGGVGYLGFKLAQNVDIHFRAMAEQTIPTIEALNDLKLVGLRIVYSTDEFIFMSASMEGGITGGKGEEKLEELRELATEMYSGTFRRYEDLVNKFFPKEKEFLESIRIAGQELRKTSAQLVESKKRGVSGMEIWKFRDKFGKDESAFLEAVDAVLIHEDQELVERKKRVESAITNGLTVILAVTALAITVAMAVGRSVSRSISRPVGTLKDAAEEIARGKFDVRVNIGSKNELGILANGFNQMVGHLREQRDQLVSAKNYVDNIIKSITDILIVLDPDGKIRSANPATVELLGYQEAELIGKDGSLIFADEAVTVLKDPRLKTLMQKGSIRNYETTCQTRTGQKIPVSFSRGVMRDENGNPAGIVGIARDLRDIKRLEEELLQAQKMEVVGRLAGGVAHDFNNLLTGIIGYTQLVLAKVGADSSTGQDLLQVYSAANRAAGLTRQLLAFSRREPLQFAVLNLNKQVENISTLLRRLIGEDIDLKFIFAPGLGSVWADPGQIEQVLMNLAVNARDAMPQGGILTIETANVVLDAHRHFGVAAGPYVRLAVTDNGCGMDEEIRRQIFEPFFTTKEKDKGTGLGLSTVYGIVKQHGGHIWVYSEPGKGTTFKIDFPRTDEQPHELPAEGREEIMPGGSETILVVEDEEAVRDLVRRALQGLGYRVLVAARAEEAEEVFAEHGNEIDLLLTDVVMPGLSGVRLYERLSAKRPSLKVLYMSGYTDAGILRNGILDQGASYIPKPFRAALLAQRVRQVLEGRGIQGVQGETNSTDV